MGVTIRDVQILHADGLQWIKGEMPCWKDNLRFSVSWEDDLSHTKHGPQEVVPSEVIARPCSQASLALSLIVKAPIGTFDSLPIAVITIPDLRQAAAVFVRSSLLADDEASDAANTMFLAEAEVLRRLEYAKVSPKLYRFHLTNPESLKKRTPRWLFDNHHEDKSLFCEFLATPDKSVRQRDIPYLLRAYVPGKSVDAWAAEWSERDARTFCGVSRLGDWFDIAEACASALESFHLERIVHGDICPENIILNRESGTPAKWTAYFVNGAQHTPEQIPLSGDFKLSSPKQPATLRRIYDDPERLYQYDPSSQMESEAVKTTLVREGFTEWYSPADIYSLGMVLYYLAIGNRLRFDPFEKEEPILQRNIALSEETTKDWSSPWHVVVRRRKMADIEVKRTLLKNLQQRCEDLESPFEDEVAGSKSLFQYEARLRIVEVLLSCLRGGLETRAPDLRAVLTTLKQFLPMRTARTNVSGVAASLQALEKRMRQVAGEFESLETEGFTLLPHPFAAVLRQRLASFRIELQELTSKRYMHLLSLSGNRYDLVSVMDSLLLSLGPGDICRALTTPTFWFEGNMGPMGRVSAALQIAALRGARINWLIIVDPERLTDQKVADVLEAHRQLQEEYYKSVESPKPVPLEPTNYEIKWAVLSPSDYLDAKRRHKSFVSFQRLEEEDSECVFMAPSYRGDANHLTALRLWVHCRESEKTEEGEEYLAAEGRRKELTEAFETFWRKGRSVSYYVR